MKTVAQNNLGLKRPKNIIICDKINKGISLCYFLRKSERGDPQVPSLFIEKMDIKAKLTEQAEASLLNSSLFLVEVVVSSRNLEKISVIIDGDNGVTIDDCTRISRELSAALDEIDFGTAHYVLEVGTPGLDHPLKLKRQFQKNKGRGLKVIRKDKSIEQGKLIFSDDEKIELKREIKEGNVMIEKDVTIPFEEIEKAFVMVSFK